MTDLIALIRLQTMMSPAFPTGAFSYSHGLEAAIGSGRVSDRFELRAWLEGLVSRGAGWNDGVMVAQAWRDAHSADALAELVELAQAMCVSKERRLETCAQGEAFVMAARAWNTFNCAPRDCPLPVAVGALAGMLELGLEETLTAYLHAYVSNQVQAAIRLMELGQRGGVAILVELEPVILEKARRLAKSTLGDLGSDAVMADIAAMQHETMESRIFRS